MMGLFYDISVISLLPRVLAQKWEIDFMTLTSFYILVSRM